MSGADQTTKSPPLVPDRYKIPESRDKALNHLLSLTAGGIDAGRDHSPPQQPQHSE